MNKRGDLKKRWGREGGNEKKRREIKEKRDKTLTERCVLLDSIVIYGRKVRWRNVEVSPGKQTSEQADEGVQRAKDLRRFLSVSGSNSSNNNSSSSRRRRRRDKKRRKRSEKYIKKERSLRNSNSSSSSSLEAAISLNSYL